MSLRETHELLQTEIKQAFNRAAKTYDKAAIFQHEIAQRLVERLELMRVQPQRILDLGCRTTYSSQLLKELYPKAKIISVDSAEQMLFTAAEKTSKHFVCSEPESLAFASQSFDLIFSNLHLHWCSDLAQVVAEMRRLLKPKGLLLFSTVGPDTFKELRESWAAVDALPHVHLFHDMHNIGDLLLHAGFVDPVMDAEYLILHYQHLHSFLADIKALGVSNKLQTRQKTLMGKAHFQSFLDHYETLRTAEGKLPVTYEVIYGHALGPSDENEIKTEHEVRIAIDQIKNIPGRL